MRKILIVIMIIVFCLPFTACGGPRQVENKSCSVVINDIVMDGSFTGTYENGKPNGSGTFSYSDDNVSVSYSGQWTDGAPSGDGALEYEGYSTDIDGKAYVGKYSGESLNGCPHGTGDFIFDDDEQHLSYSGVWENGFPFGNGQLEVEKMEVTYMGINYIGRYIGEAENGMPCGNGEFSAENGDKYLSYSGVWTDGSISGPGEIDTNAYTVNFKDGVNRTGIYTGDIVKGIAEGNGTFTAESSDGLLYTYTGEWHNGLWNGTGVRSWPESEYYECRGTFEDGNFVPTPAELFDTLGTWPEQEYTITEAAWDFMSKNPEVFTWNSFNNDYTEYENNFNYKSYTKNPSKYGSKLIGVPQLTVIQIFESTNFGYDYTFLIAEDSQYNVYYVNIIGHWANVYEGSTIKLTALPLDYFTYPNIGGSKTWAIACAGVRID